MLLTIELTIKISKFEIEICILKTLIRIFVDQLFKNIPCGRKFCVLSSHESTLTIDLDKLGKIDR